MAALTDLILQGERARDHRPWPRALVDPAAWSFAADQLAAGHWTLLGLWGEPRAVHMALLDEPAGAIGVLSLDCPERRFPSIGARHPPALRLERAARDLFGLVPEGLPDGRPWLDHGRWGVRAPLGAATACDPPDAAYVFLPAEASHVPMFAHLALVLGAGVYLPPPLVAWFQQVAGALG